MECVELVNSWQKILWQKEFVQHYRYIFNIYSRNQPPELEVDQILPELVYIRIVSVLDDVFSHHIDSKGLHMSKKYRQNLSGRTDFLNDQCMLKNSKNVLDKIRERRNDIAHDSKINKNMNWDEVDSTIDIIHAELQNILHLGHRPKYNLTVNRNAFKKSNKPGIFGTFDYEIRLTQDGKKRVVHSWTEQMLDD